MAARRANQASRKAPPPEEKPPLPGWIWGAAGLAIGLFTALLVYLDSNAPRHEADGSGSREAGGGTASSGEGERPRFDFYTLLPELEVAVPGNAPPTSPLPPEPEPSRSESRSTPEEPEPTPGSGDESSADTRLLLQAGAFRESQQADRMRASLAMLGIEAHIQKVRANNDTWHRVRIGPFDDQEAMERMRSRLAEHQIQTVTVKAPGSG
ncbi:MAG: SPOR domain-containing protein [Ectothiorhodospira sp.]